jgi:hypothetical protein
MYRRRLVIAPAAFAAGAVLLALVLGVATGPAVGGIASQAQQHAVTVVVTITDTTLELLPATVPVGTVVFKVVNRGTIPRDFRIGPAGKRTPRIAAGKSATLTVEFATSASLLVLSYGVGGTAGLSYELKVVAPCTTPKTTTVRVQMREAPERFSQTRVPCGTVKFVVTNVGTIVHSFNITAPGNLGASLTRGPGPRILPGHTVSFTVHFTSKGRAFYYCGETEHNELYGEDGYLHVV